MSVLHFMSPHPWTVDEKQRPCAGIAQRYRHPPPEFASAISNSALEAIVEHVRLSNASPSAKLRNWAGVYASDAPSTHDGAFGHMDRRTFAPSTIEHVVAIVELARRRAIPVRAVGRCHSPSDLPFSLGWTIRTDELHGIVRVDEQAREVCALGGTYVSTLNDALAEHEPSLGLSNLGSISEQTLAGLISTASHGSGIHFPVISAQVRSLDIVCPLASGTQVVTCNRDEKPDLFNASLCGLGVTGVIVAVTFAVEPAFRLKQVSEEVPEDTLLGSAHAPTPRAFDLAPDMLSVQPYETFIEHPAWLGIMLANGVPLPPPRTHAASAVSRGPQCVYPFEPTSPLPSPLVHWNAEQVQSQVEQLVSSAEHVRFLWSPHAHMITVDRATRTNAPADAPALTWSSYLSAKPLIKAMLFASRFSHSLTPATARAAYYLTHPSAPSEPREQGDEPGGMRPIRPDTAISVRVDDAPRIFNFDCLCEQYTTEFAIPYEYTGAALLAIRTWLELEHANADGERIHFPVEVRFADADGIWLSPSYGRKTCYIGIVQYRPYGWPARYRRLFSRFEALMRQFDGRPHWAKTHTAYKHELLQRYPHMSEWLSTTATYDPDRLLVNPYVARHLMDEHAALRLGVFRKSRL